MAAAAHRVAVAAGALACPFRPSWRCQAGAAADHPEPGRSKVARFFLAVRIYSAELGEPNQEQMNGTESVGRLLRASAEQF